MYNPFLTDDERASIRRGERLMRLQHPSLYWRGQIFIYGSGGLCLAIVVFLLFGGAYWNVVFLLLFFAVIYLACSWGAAWDIRRDNDGERY